MTFTQKIQKAINTSARLHRAHIRIGLDLPYIVHPYSVAVIISQYTTDEDVVCAGLLHDILEDAEGYSYDNLEADFGRKVAQIVKGVTERRTFFEDGTIAESWHERKYDYLKNLERASQESLLVCAADTTHNIQSLLQTHYLLGDTAWGSFHASMEEKLGFYENVIATLKRRLNSEIVVELESVYESLCKALAEKNAPREPAEAGLILF